MSQISIPTNNVAETPDKNVVIIYFSLYAKEQ
jgi:hypothetical protein